jgi:hypothetical protein
VIDFSDCFYIDPEGIRWLAAAKAGNAQFVDRRSGQDRRAGESDRTSERRSKPDRRNHAEF